MSQAANDARAESSLIPPAALMRIRNLELRARVVVEGFWSGLHRSPYHGFSVEFTEYREYTAGDDPRYLDWRVLARTDRYFVKKFEDETNLRCHFVLDTSRSMCYGSGPYSKGDYAATLAATLAYFLYRQGDAVGLVTFDSILREVIPARHRPGQLRHLLQTLERPSEGTATDLATPLKSVVELVRKRGLIVVVSDFLAPLDRLRPALAGLAASGHELVLFQVLDPAERTLELGGPAMVRDAETGQTMFIDPAVERVGYSRRLETHIEQLRSASQGLGAAFHSLTLDGPLELVLFDFLRGRSQRRKTQRRLRAAA